MAATDNRRFRDDNNDDKLRELVRSAVRDVLPSQACLSDDELAAVRLLIVREAQRSEFRRAVIEKSFVGLIWAGVVAAGVIVSEYAVSHGMWRP